MSKETKRRVQKLDHPFDRIPDPEELFQVAPGVYWVRMPLDLTGLDHINLWLLKDGDGWTMVDTGMNSDTIREHWQHIFADKLAGLPITRVICTHFHPDHMGLAGWVTEQFNCPLWVSRGEWTFGQMISLQPKDQTPDYVIEHFRAIGLKPDALEAIRARGLHSYSSIVWPITPQYRRIKHNDVLHIGGRAWRVVHGNGHSPEHSCLHCDELKLLISGDQVLPRITPHIGVYPEEPDGNPLQDYLDSLVKLKDLPDDVLVLPAHGDPFRGLHKRLDFLLDHHHDSLDDLEQFVDQPTRVLSTLKVLFHRRLGNHEAVLGMSESIAHLNCLIALGKARREVDENGVWLYSRTDDRDARAA